jgi:transcriptional regulator with XRE-family HTH domain
MLNNNVSSALNKKTVRLLNMSSLQDRIRLALSRARINASALAKRAQVSRGTVSLWVNGPTQTIEGDNLVRAAKVLGVDTHWLATGEGVPHQDEPPGAEEPRASYEVISARPIGQLLDTLRGEISLQPRVIINSVAQLITAFIHETNPETRAEIIEAISRLLPDEPKPPPAIEHSGVREKPRSLPRPQSEEEHVHGNVNKGQPKKLKK